jgi:hypothetical protein
MYEKGAMIHDTSQGYEVTAHYECGALQCGHHIFNGATLPSSTTNFWLTTDGLVGAQGSVHAVEQANAGHDWTFQHAGGPLFITYLDDYYGDNQGPGSVFCISP